MTKDGSQVITRFAAEELMVADLRYHTATGRCPREPVPPEQSPERLARWDRRGPLIDQRA